MAHASKFTIWSRGVYIHRTAQAFYLPASSTGKLIFKCFVQGPQIRVEILWCLLPFTLLATNHGQLQGPMSGFFRLSMSSLCCTLCSTFTLNATSNKTMFPMMCGSLVSYQWLWYMSPTWFILISTCHVLSNIYTALAFPTLPDCWWKKFCTYLNTMQGSFPLKFGA